ncbi:MAG: CBS domain-containing protein, partial [Bacteroidales bacterium]|nr:CBS domain-containing protein [Bacteroidales bacterium]
MIADKIAFEELIENKEWKLIKQSLDSYDSIQLAELIEESSGKEKIILFRLLSRIQSKEVFKLLSCEKQERLIEGLMQYNQKLTDLLNDLEPDDRTAFFEELSGELSQQLIQWLSPEEREKTIQLLGYPEYSIGRLMTPEYISIKPQDTVEQAFKHIREYGRDSETLNVIYIVDDESKLIDDLRIKELILASPQQKIEELMDWRFVALNVMDDQESAIKVFRDYDRVALPVVSAEGVLIGIVSFDDIMDVVEEESTEDFLKFGSFQEAIANPLTARIGGLFKSRIVWLVALVFM